MLKIAKLRLGLCELGIRNVISDRRQGTVFKDLFA